MRKISGQSDFVKARALDKGEMFTGVFIGAEEIKIEGNESASVKGNFTCLNPSGGAMEPAALWFPAALQNMLKAASFKPNDIVCFHSQGLVKGKKGRYNSFEVFILSDEEYNKAIKAGAIKAAGVTDASIYAVLR